ncbi:unnamed protein product [Gulo gulo]|uniref:Uncharacterized protein n=1 Tax=Gulo gulo TaxID=48420 RepID=A0A9X9LR53_GULGU|nr:unnamed protein product [Gulo gulo]
MPGVVSRWAAAAPHQLVTQTLAGMAELAGSTQPSM